MNKKGMNHVFCPHYDCNHTSLDDWKCDQLKWKHFGRKMLKTEPLICKTYYNYKAGQNIEKKEFKCYSYTIPSNNNQLTLIHYKGDDPVMESDPHVRTCPSVLKDIQQTTQSPRLCTKKQCHHLIVHFNTNQYLYQGTANKFQTCKHCKDKNSGSVTMHYITPMSWHYDIPDFIHKIVTYPDLIICGIKRIQQIIRYPVNSCHVTQLFSSEIFTFHLHFFGNTLFQNAPVMPAMFVIHERKLKVTW